MELLQSILVYGIFYSLQLYFSRRDQWVLAFLLPISVIAVTIIKAIFFPMISLPFFDSNILLFCYLGGAFGAFFVGIRNKNDKTPDLRKRK